MSNIFEYWRNYETPFLEELTEELEGVCKVIIFTNHSENLDYIRNRQRELKDRYGKYLNQINSEIGLRNIIPAYEEFQELLYDNPSQKEIVQRCEDCLETYLTARADEDYED